MISYLVGCTQGVGVPATHHLFGQWLPPLERSKLMGHSYAGITYTFVISRIDFDLVATFEFSQGVSIAACYAYALS